MALIRLPKTLADLISTTLSPLIDKARSSAQGAVIAGEDTQLFKFLINGEYNIKEFPANSKAKLSHLKTMCDAVLSEVALLLAEDRRMVRRQGANGEDGEPVMARTPFVLQKKQETHSLFDI